MRRVLALAALIGLAWLIQRVPGGAAPAAQGTLVAGLVLLAGYVAGHLVVRLRLPRISGYLLVGLTLGPHAVGLMGAEEIADLGFLNELAVAFIALAAGAELRLHELRDRYGVISRVLVAQTLAVVVAVFLTAVAARSLIPFATPFSATQFAAVALLFGVLAVARSPSSAIAVIRECRARGPFTETALGVTVAMDSVVIILFALALSACQVVMVPGARLDTGFALAVAGELAAGVGMGLVVGFGLAFYVDRVRRELPVVLLGTALLVTELAHGLAHYLDTALDVGVHLEPLLICVTAGFTVQNFSAQGERFAAALDTVNLPVFVLFFTLAGAGLDLGALRSTWAIALLLVGVRATAMLTGSYLGGRWGGDPPLHNRVSGLAHLTQAGVSLGLALQVAARFPDWGPHFAAVTTGAIALNQIVGPVTMRYAFYRVGEARAGKRAGGEGQGPDGIAAEPAPNPSP